MPLKGKVAIITGAAMGIGRAVAHRFAHEGAKIIIADIDEDGGETVAKELKARGTEAEFVHCNVAEKLDVHNLVATALESFGQVDILLNAAIARDNTPFLSLKEQEFNAILDINLKGAFLLGRAVAKQMLKQKNDEKGTIIFVSTVHSVLAEPNAVAFSAASGGVSQLIKAMSQALAPHGIRVNGIGTSNILRPKLEELAKNEEERKRALERTPLGRFGTPEEIAAIATFLASTEASYITGQTIYADGGALSMRRPLSDQQQKGDPS